MRFCDRLRLGSFGFRRLVLTVSTSITMAIGIDHAIQLGRAGNWPQWRYDAGRSGSTADAGPEKPRLLWQLDLGTPDPAYDHQYRMCADVTYAPVAAEGLVFIPSNRLDQVMACDLLTGVIRWRCFAEAPVRFAPVYDRGRVYFTADDGCLYCVSAQAGRPLWKVRGVPEALPASRMWINGRFCSRWPARGGPVLDQGVVYFGAGVWPEEGVDVCAVRADTGRVLWRSDSLSFIKDGMSDHGNPYDLSLPPQGYLAIVDGKLAVPSGRSLAAWLNPATGVMEPYTCFYVKNNPPRGTWYVAGTEHYCVQGGNWFGTRPEAAPPIPADLSDAKSALFWSRQAPANERYVVEHRPFLRADTYRVHDENLYTEPVLTPTTVYQSEFSGENKYLVPRGHTRVSFPAFDRIVARDLTHAEWHTVDQPHFAYGRRRVKMLRLGFPMLWELPSPLRVLIKAGDQLYAGGQDTIAAIAIPAPGQKPHIAWQAAVDGTPVNALVADGELIAVTHSGHVYCFGSGAGSDIEPTEIAGAKRASEFEPSAFAAVFGWDDGTQVVRIARQRKVRIIVFEPDADRATAARQVLANAGLYGQRVQVVQGSPNLMQLTPYWASLVTVSSLAEFTDPEVVLAKGLDILRPYNGELLLPNSSAYGELLRRLVGKRTGYELSVDGANILVARKSPPQGSDDWTHEAGGADNAFANSEECVKWPLAVLWYSGQIDRRFTPAMHFQHERNPYPLVVGGRMFLITGRLLHALDIFTGNYLWKTELPLTPWVRTWFLDSRMYGRPTERNYVAATDCVYVVVGAQIMAFDVTDGRQVHVFEIPSRLRERVTGEQYQPREVRYQGESAAIQAAPLWTEVRLWKNLLLAVVGHNLIALDRHTGQTQWMRSSTRQTTTYCLGSDRLFGLDCDVPKLSGSPAAGTATGLLFALDPEDGSMIWQESPEYPAVPKQQIDNARIWLRPILPELAYNRKHDLLVMTVNRNDLHVLHANDGSPAWSKHGLSTGNLQRIYPPAVTDDYLVISNYRGCFGYVLDIQTGRDLGNDTGIPRPRTCARILGNNHLLVYRDAATEMYDLAGNRMIGFHSLRSGCTTSFIPADGIMTAPMLGHGCVCNYPMFASLALYHWPGIDDLRPPSVTRSWVNQAAQLFQDTGGSDRLFAAPEGHAIDLKPRRLGGRWGGR